MFNEEERLVYEVRMQSLAEVESKIASAIEKGMEKGMERGLERGMEKGREEGREEGELNKSLEIARNMLFEGCEPVFIAKITQLPMDQIKALQKEIG